MELSPGSHRLSVLAGSAVSRAVSEEVLVRYQPTGTPPATGGSNLCLLAVGIDAYPGRFRLQCATADARALADLLQHQKGRGLYQDVNVKMVLDREANREGLRKGLKWLRSQARPNDLVVFFYAGHGVRDRKGVFGLVPVDTDVDRLESTILPEDELKEALTALPGKVLVLLDACHSGKIGESGTLVRGNFRAPAGTDDLARELARSQGGLVVMCAATGAETSEESTELGHGYFTQALLEGLSGKADYNHTGVVRLTGLDNYVADRVRELSKGEQTACTAKSTRTGSFPLVRP